MTGGGLNRAQAQAVRTLSGRLIVDAGAGSGKTRVLAERFANALSGSHSPEWEPVGVDEVVAITFTDKAAGELAERIRRSLRAVGMGDEARRLDAAWISTIHGLCARILRRHAIEAGLDPDARVADDVLAGRIREAAFESAAEAALRSDEGKLLLSAYRYDALFDQVASLAAALRLARAEPRDLETERAADFCGLIAEAKDAFSDARACFCACSPTQKTAVAHAEACARVVMELEELARLEDHGHSEEYLSQKLWSVLDSWSPGRSSRAVEEARDELRERHANLIERAASIAVRPYAKALTELAAEFAERYEQLKREAGVLDFDDLQLKTVALLDKDPRLAARYRSAFKLMMVDEFQDTDRLQLSLIELLSDDNVCTVGDERQSIYGFRGADVSVYREHVERADERGVTRIPLSVNYRSHPAVIEFVNELFGRELLFGERFQNLEAGRLEADPERVDPETPRMGFVFGERVSQSGTPARLAVADAVARRMHALVAAGRFRAGEMAILLRSYRHAADYASALRRHGLSAVVVGGSRFFSLVEVAVMRALTRCIANTQDDEALSLLAASSFSGITADGLWRLRSRVISDRTAMTDALTDAVGLSPNDARCAARLLDSLDVARSLGGRLPLGSVLLAAVEKGEWFGRLLETGDEGQQAIANILKVARLADGFAATGAGAAEFSEYLDAKERLAVHEPPATLVGEDESVVRIMSIHAAKGLEFPVVVLAGLDDSPRADTSIALVDLRAESSPKLAVSLPSSMQDGTRPETRRTQAFAELHEMQAELDRDEAKRLFYVGCTRAEELLILAGTAGAKGPKPDTMLDWLLRATGVPVRESEPAKEVTFGSVVIGVERVREAELEREGAPPLDAPTVSSLPAKSGVRRSTTPARQAAQGPPRELSYSALAAFEECPARFRLTHMLGLREARGLESRAIAFGSAVHAALEVGVVCGALNGDRLDAIASQFELDAGERARLEAASRVALESEPIEAARGCESVRTEVSFGLSIGAEQERRPAFVLIGAIDVYATTGDCARIVDYKSGRSGAPSELAERYRLQAVCYALAAFRDQHSVVEVDFVRPEVLDDNGMPQSVHYSFTAGEAADIEAELLAIFERMSASAFEPIPEGSEACGRCAAAGPLCDSIRAKRVSGG